MRLRIIASYLASYFGGMSADEFSALLTDSGIAENLKSFVSNYRQVARGLFLEVENTDIAMITAYMAPMLAREHWQVILSNYSKYNEKMREMLVVIKEETS